MGGAPRCVVDDPIYGACAVQFAEESMQLPDGFFVRGDDREGGHSRSLDFLAKYAVYARTGLSHVGRAWPHNQVSR
jgi:hypothetical protein